MTRSYSRCILDKLRMQVNCSISDSGSCVCLFSAIYSKGFLLSLSVQNISLIGVGLSLELSTFISRSFAIANGPRDSPLDLLFESSDVF